MTRSLPLIAALSLLACDAPIGDPRPQWLVTVSTNAPIPQFGDRLRIDFLNDAGEACASCSRLLDASHPSAFPISFGSVRDDSLTQVRARLFRSTTLQIEGEPPPASTIDAIVQLPKADKVIDVDVQLAVACFGIPADPLEHRSCDPTTGTTVPTAPPSGAAPLAVASWPGAATIPCALPAPDGAACVPGGAFILGDASLQPIGDASIESVPESVVTMPPFFLDLHELTVGEYRALKAAHPNLPMPVEKDPGSTTGVDSCTYLRTSTENDALPLNCVTKPQAIAICKANGDRRLPTEAEWEFAAGNGAKETHYPWGDDVDICAHATIAIAGIHGARVCQKPDGPLDGWPLASTGNDLTDQGIVDLGGSLIEWIADDFDPYGKGCWLGHAYQSPLCHNGGENSAVRGGDWGDTPIGAEGARRRAIPKVGWSNEVGFRCALDAD